MAERDPSTGADRYRDAVPGKTRPPSHSLLVAETVGYRLYEETAMPRDAVRARVEEGSWHSSASASSSTACRRHSPEVSSLLRVAIARAMASKPHLLPV